MMTPRSCPEKLAFSDSEVGMAGILCRMLLVYFWILWKDLDMQAEV